jgi:hypothetical protein
MDPRCVHCGEPIRKTGGWWTHQDEMIGIYCQTTTASPPLSEAARARLNKLREEA